MRTIDSDGSAAKFRFALVVSRYNDFVTDRLQSGALAALSKAGVPEKAITIVRVPGAFEIPTAAKRAAESGHADEAKRVTELEAKFHEFCTPFLPAEDVQRLREFALGCDDLPTIQPFLDILRRVRGR